MIFVFQNCQKEDNNSLTTQENVLNIKKITLKEFSSNPINSRALRFLEPQHKNQNSRTIDATNGAFSVDTDEIV